MAQIKLRFITVFGTLFWGLSAQASLLLPDEPNCESGLARTFLKYKVVGSYYKNNQEQKLNLAALNKKLKRAGHEELPPEVTVGLSSKKTWKRYKELIEKGQELLGYKFDLSIDRRYMHELPEMCYYGSPIAVITLLQKLESTFFHEDQGFLAYRVGTKRKSMIEDEYSFSSDYARTRKNYEENGYEGVVEEFLQDEPGNRDVLIFSNLGPQGDGTELYSTRIKPCPSI